MIEIFYSPKQALRHSFFEIHDGQVLEAFERPSRMEFILDELAKRGFPKTQEPSEFGLEMAARVHRQDYIDFLARAYDDWLKEGKTGEALTNIWPATTMRQDVIPDAIEAKMGYYSLASETTITKGTWEAVLASKDCAEAATQRVIEGAKCAFSLARPPGHHAASYQYGGYCFLNNAAIAAERFLQNGAKRVSILDVDFHHGNGTQEIFYQRSDVQFLSLHGDPNVFFPHFLGYQDEKGAGAGEGFNHNYPLPNGTAYEPWREALVAAIKEIERYKPDALVISLGVDTFEQDPISGFKLKSEDFTKYGKLIARLNLPSVFIMEGGYAIDAIGVNTVNVLEGFLGG